MITKSRLTFAILAFLMGALISPTWPFAKNAAMRLYDNTFPVVTMSGKVTNRMDDFVDVNVGGEKHRPCKFVSLQAFTRLNGVLRDSNLKRVDMPAAGDTKPLGSFNIGVWRVWPVNGGNEVVMYVTHDCDGRFVVTKIADERL